MTALGDKVENAIYPFIQNIYIAPLKKTAEALPTPAMLKEQSFGEKRTKEETGKWVKLKREAISG